MNRLKDKWGKEKRYYLPSTGEDKEFREFFDKRYKKYNKNKTDDDLKNFFWNQLEYCVEIVLSYEKERGYILNPIIQTIDSVTLEIIEGPVLEMYGFENDDELKHSLAMAMVREVPIFGNNQTLQKKVDLFQKDIIINGFIEKDKRYALKAYKDYASKDMNKILKRLNESAYITKAEINLLNESISSKFKEYTNVAKFLSRMETIISDFTNLLSVEERNENKIQKYITENPILLGTEYKTVLPKHKLGAEFEMDYALERFDGVFDLVELESSNLQLFNKNGQASQYLVHAEQQVLDWQQWLEEKNYYAQERLENISSPAGIIVIGRNRNTDLKKLRRRNIAFSNGIKIYTYDQLLEKLKILYHNILKGKE